MSKRTKNKIISTIKFQSEMEIKQFLDQCEEKNILWLGEFPAKHEMWANSIEVGDIVNVYDMDGEICIMPVLAITLSIDDIDDEFSAEIDKRQSEMINYDDFDFDSITRKRGLYEN